MAVPTGERRRADVVVLGTGIGGERVAYALARAGRSVVAIEQSFVGGACPYVACIPSKSLHISARLGLSWADAVRRRDEHAAHRNDAVAAAGLIDAGVRLLRGAGRVVAPGLLEVRAAHSHVLVGYSDLVVATGSSAVRPEVPGLSDVPTWYSAQALASDVLPASLAVLGGGTIGCEMAQVYALYGTQVTLVEPALRLLPEEPPFVGRIMEQALAGNGVRVLTASAVQRAEPARGGARLHLGEGATVEVERVLLTVGRSPRNTGLGLEQHGVRVVEGDPLRVDDRCAVTESVWAVGDVTDVAPYAHTAHEQARVVVSAMNGGGARLRPTAMPRAVYTEPSMVGIGPTPETAVRAGVLLDSAGFDLGDTPRGRLERAAGRVELYADPDRGVLVGGVGIGPRAEDWMAEVILAVRAAVPLDVLADTVQPYPTFAEVLYPPVAQLLRARGG